MKVTRLRGWSIAVDKRTTPGQDDEWVVVFTERMPPTGDQIVFEMDRGTRDGVVRQLTNGVVLAGGDFPRL